MRQRNWLYALGFLVVAAGGCKEERTWRMDGVAALEPAVVDFGKVGLGTTAAKMVVIKNQGRAPLGIVGWEMEGEGDDFAVSLQGKRRVYEGGSVVLTLRYTPDEEELLERRLVVETDDPSRSRIEVGVIGEAILPFVVPEPGELDFGRVEVGTVETLPLIVTNGFDLEMDVRIGTRGDGQFLVEPTAVTLDPFGEATVDVSFAPSRFGQAEGELVLIPCPACEEIAVPLRGAGIDQALVVVPPEVDFGFVPVERSAQRSFTVTNVSSRAVEIHSMELVGESTNFTLTPVLGALDPGEAIQVEVGFSPTLLDPEEQIVEIASTSARAPVVEVRLIGAGGGPQIQIAPENLSFGAVPVGSRGQIDLIITNAGTTPGAPPLEILDVRVENPAVGPFGPDRDLAADPVILGAGEQDRITIGYEPLRATGGALETAELVVVSNDASRQEIRIPMSGSGITIPPCTNLEVSPEVLDFGALDEGHGAVLSVSIYNPGPETCIMRNLRIAEGSDPVFQTREVQSFLIPGDQSFGWMVNFDPRAEGAGEGAYRGELELFAINATAQQRYAVSLRASSDNGCLLPEPNFLDFGSERSDCGERTGSVRFTNVCPLPLGIGAIELGEQAHPGDFEILSAPAPFDLPSMASFDVHVQWNTLQRGLSTAPLYVTEDTRARPLMVPLLGELQRDGRTVDRFVQQHDDAVDVLLVVDNSSTMTEEQPRLRAASRVLIDEAEARGLDYHIGVTSTGLIPGVSAPACPGGADGAEAGRLFPVDASRPRIVTEDLSDPRRTLADNTQVGFCHELEQGMEAMRFALTEPLLSGSNRGFLRSDTQLSVIFVTDEDDHSGFPASEYADFLLSLKGVGGGRAHGIVDIGSGCPEGAGRATRLIDLVTSTGGVVEDLCQRDWAGAMRRIADNAYFFRTAFSLSRTPDGDGITVTVDGRTADPATYRYDAASNSLTFSPGNRPAAGSVVEIRYAATCG